MSDGYRTPNNIYEKLGFVYEDDSGPAFSISDVTTSNENAANATFTVSLSAASV